jgi:hypothetical protein
MSTAADVSTQPQFRTYGGWRPPGRPGLGQFGFAPTLLVFAGLIVVVATLAVTNSIEIAGVIALCFAVVIAPLVIKDRHRRNALQGLCARVSWAIARAGGRHIYRSGPTGRMASARWSLPGLAATITATSAVDSAGRSFALLHHTRTHLVTAVIETAPEGSSLVDPATVDYWVASWGEFLAALGQEPSLVGASVTIETAPDPGTRLAYELHRRLKVNAPELARSVLEEIVATYPCGAALSTARIALTWTCNARVGSARRSVKAMAGEVGRRLPALCLGLAATGAGAARPMSVGELAGAIRSAYDPAAARDVESCDPAALGWDNCGPVAADEAKGHYAHDGSVSVSWTMTSASRGAVPCTVLMPILAPHPDIARKRVTLHFRPYSPAQAASLVERDRRDALFAANGSKIPRAVDLAKLAAAQQAAAEDARGAGLVRFGMTVTATVDASRNEADTGEAVALAVAAVEGLATSSRLELRRAWRCQATTFLAGLPLGIVLPRHLKLPSELREML